MGDSPNQSKVETSASACSLGSDRIEAFVQAYGVDLLALARARSLCAADADDVFQRALETLITKAPRVDNDRQLLAWVKTVITNEAISEHRTRSRRQAEVFDDDSTVVDFLTDEPAALVDGSELRASLGEALRRVRPDHARCLLLRAEGFDYPRISEITGFSYAKVNRCLSEGRSSLRTQYVRITGGHDCERLSGALSAYADDSVAEKSRNDVELHLKNCLACQSALREYRDAPRRVAAALPLGLLEAAPSGAFERGEAWLQRMVDGVQSAWVSVQEQVALRSSTIFHGSELVTAKNAFVAAGVSASLVVGTAGVAKVVREDEPAVRSAGSAANSVPMKVAPIDSPKPPANEAGRQEVEEEVPTEATSADVEKPKLGRQVDTPNRSVSTPEGESVPAEDAWNDQSIEPTDEFVGSNDSVPGLAP